MKNKSIAAISGLLLCLLAPAIALAHHGQDFLLVESPSVPHPGHAYLLANAQVALDSRADERAGFEPALLVGITPRVALELHAHAEKPAGERWNYEATAPSLHVLLTDPARHGGLKAGLSAEYEIAREADVPDRLELRLSMDRRIDAWKLGGNLVYSREQHAEGEYGMTLGLRRTLGEHIALGVETQGAFGHAPGREALAGLYWEPSDTLALKFGLGLVRDDAGRELGLARVGLVLRLHGG